MQTTIQKWGNSQAIRLPKALLELANMQENDRVRLLTEGDKIIICRDVSASKMTLKERLAGYNGDYAFTEWDTGEPTGREII